MESSESAEEMHLPEFATWPALCESTGAIIKYHS